MRTLLYSLIALVLLGIGGAGGYFYGVTVGETRAADIRARFIQDRGITDQAVAGGAGATGATGQGANGAQGGAGGFAQFGGGGGGTFGSVKSVEGNVIEVSTAQAVIKVTVPDGARIQETVQQQVTLNDLKPGMNVVVQGDRDAQGNVTARTINLVAQGVGGGQGGQGGQAGQGGTPQAGQGQGGQGGRRQGGQGQGGQGGTPPAGAPPATPSR